MSYFAWLLDKIRTYKLDYEDKRFLRSIGILLLGSLTMVGILIFLPFPFALIPALVTFGITIFVMISYDIYTQEKRHSS